eukprot:SM000067S20329  [mRNA]  locus=s67:313938:314832:- [translate_table: standard]
MKELGARGEQPKAFLLSSRQQSSLDCVLAPEKTPSDRTVAQSFLSITLDPSLRLGGLATCQSSTLTEACWR